MAQKSNLDLVKECDNFPYYHDGPELYDEYVSNSYYQFRVSDCNAIVGYIPTAVVDRMPWSKNWNINKESKSVTFMFERSTDSAEKDCSKGIAEFLQQVRTEKTFQVLDGWRSELYPIYGPNRQLLMSMERSATPLFGVVSYGVHMTAFVKSSEGLKIWVPRRSKTKQTYPGMMDNTVAGGISTGEKPFNCLIREAQEEASLPEKVVRSAKSCGTLSYFYVRDARAGGEVGLCQPECQYLYDLELSPEVIPKPCDNESVDFRLLTVQEVQDAISAGQFKPNCALVLLDFFVRHGILTAENEPDYVEIVSRLHRKLEFPTI